jgi:hypothetical protein
MFSSRRNPDLIEDLLDFHLVYRKDCSRENEPRKLQRRDFAPPFRFGGRRAAGSAGSVLCSA